MSLHANTLKNTFATTCNKIRMEVKTENAFGSLISTRLPVTVLNVGMVTEFCAE
jgi:hypothetical protein